MKTVPLTIVCAALFLPGCASTQAELEAEIKKAKAEYRLKQKTLKADLDARVQELEAEIRELVDGD